MSTLLHKKKTPSNLRIAIISASSTSSISEDKSGIWIKKQAKKEGHDVVVHHTVTDDIKEIQDMVNHIILKISPDVILITGGTGITKKDVTIEAVTPLFDKELTAYATLFAQLSFEEIDSAAMLSRATAGVIKNSILFCMPGSLKACKLACKALIFPELGHLMKHIRE
ncbi:MAG: MogA/MoaB family molybdenum cofactor biosynthesis protein [Desulfobacteraceae bacterium]|nr:MogA/MoaB family molybdenum cofactor biosynthesis protein [Desulfobacteraceae bacterium]